MKGYKWPQLANGSTRWAVMTKNWVFKFPYINRGWTAFLRGLISNHNETTVTRYLRVDVFIPVSFSLPLGLLVVMRRATPATKHDYAEWVAVSCESKHPSVVSSLVGMTSAKSIGRYQGKVRAFDYGTLIEGGNEEKYFQKIRRGET